MSLLTDAQLAAIQKVGVLGMTTRVQIFSTTFNAGLDDEDPYGSKLTYSTTPVATVNGWLVGSWANDRDSGIGDVNTTTQYKLRLPVGTEIEPGWTVEINGASYLVEDAGTDQTWPEWLVCILKRNK